MSDQAQPAGFPVAHGGEHIAEGELDFATDLGGYVLRHTFVGNVGHVELVRVPEVAAIGDAAGVAAAYDEILKNAKAYKGDARIEGVLVQEMVGGGIEAIIGITNDALFGPAVMFGLGGIFAEVLKDVSFRLAPITPAMAREMVEEIKGYPVLAGARGKPAADVDALVDTLVKRSALAVDLKDSVAELDINPLIVMPKGKGVKAADALIKTVIK